MARITGTTTLLVAAATATCGLFVLSSFGPAASGSADMPAVAPDPTTDTTEPDVAATATSEPSTTTTTTTSTTTTTTTTTMIGSAPTKVPISVTASNTIVGAGGVVTFDGICAGVGPVFVEIAGQTTDIVEIGLSDPTWRYDWTAPSNEAEFGGFAFRFFCGEPADFSGAFPAELERRVDMVSIGAPPPPTTVLVESEPPVVSVLPETD